MCLIQCSKDCHYQKDGYCGLDSAVNISELHDDTCVYYKSKQNDFPTTLTQSK